MRAHLIHGFNVSDGGKGSVGNLAPALEVAGIEPVLHDYGWVGPLRLRFRNRATGKHLLQVVAPGDVLIGHSNGALLCWQLIEAGAPASAVVTIQPAMRRTAVWRSDVPVLALWNPHDLAVQFGRIWSRLTTAATAASLLPRLRPHGWGAAGRYGFTACQPNITQWNTAQPHWRHPVRGHSNVLRSPAVDVWAPLIAAWLERSGAAAKSKNTEELTCPE